jgi:hypothetical protein
VGLERTFCLGNALSSIEFRLPLALTLDSDMTVDAPSDVNHLELGNVTMIFKMLIYQSYTTAAAVGLAFSVPTADDLDLRLSDGTQLVRIENQSIHAIPYVGLHYAPAPRYFVHSFLSLDRDLNGNQVQANLDGFGLFPVGRWRDQTFLFFDVGVGAWLFRDAWHNGLSGLALTAELHYSQTLDDADAVRTDGLVVGDPNASLSLVNGTLGTHLEFGPCTIATVGYSFPLTSDERVFDGELRIFVNQRF